MVQSSFSQEPGEPTRADIITEDSPFMKELEKQVSKEKAPQGEEVPVAKSQSSGPKRIPNSYIVLVNDAYIAPFANTKAKFSNRESQIAEAKKHEAAAQKAIRKYATETLGLSNDEIGEIYTGVTSGFSVKLKGQKSSASWLTKTKSQTNVLDVIQDEEMELAEHHVESVVDTYHPAVWGQYADYSNTLVGGCDCTGHNKWAWIIDTGIDLNHPDLNVKTDYGKSFINGESPEDYRGHGTHVAGIIAAKNNSFGAKGIAAGAWVVPLKVFPKVGGADYSKVVAALDWVYTYGHVGDIVNISLGSKISPSAPETAVEKAIKKLAEKGIYVIIAAGNDKIHASGFHPARVNGFRISTIAATAKINIPWSIGTHFAAWYSNYGKDPVDYAAPGTSIYSTYKSGGYAFLTGTSMAAPNFAGAKLCGMKEKKGYKYIKVYPSNYNLYIVRPN